jgi:hypothetical protein
MKKRFISTVAMLALLFGPMSLQTAKSQILILEEEELAKLDTLRVLDGLEEDVVVDEEEGQDVDSSVDEQGLERPIEAPKGGITIDEYAPLSGEILVLACLGGAYLLGRRRRKE